MLGPSGRHRELGDPVADRNTKEKFVSAYDAKHAIEMEGDGTQTLIAGDDDWPFPIPLVNKAGHGSSTRRQDSTRSCVGASAEMSFPLSKSLSLTSRRRTDMPGSIRRTGPHVYAQRIVSRPGKKILYWPTAEGETPSPLGELAAKASAEGYKAGTLRYRITAITTASSSAKALAHPGARTTIS